MQTHSDRDAPEILKAVGDPKSEQIRNLERRAREMVERGQSRITAGGPGEELLLSVAVYGVHVTRLPDDPDCLRISLGEVLDEDAVRYLSFRGDPGKCLDLLERATNAMRSVVQKAGARA